MNRLGAATRVVREAYPSVADPLAVAVTRAGGAAGLMVGLALLYWLSDRRRTAAVVAYAFAAYAVVLGLKSFFGLPRPPEAVWLVETSGYGFPSGHATAAAVVYGGIALEFDWPDTPARQAPFAALAVGVGLSRVVLGVHYLGDVLAGLVLGAALLAGLHVATDGEPTLAFAVAGALGVGALATTAGDPAVVPEVLGIVGACVGGVVGTWNVDAIPRPGSRLEAGVLVAVGLGYLVGLRVAGEAFTGLAAGVDDALLVAGIVLLPRLVGRVWPAGTS